MNDFNDQEAESRTRGPVVKRPCTATEKGLSQIVSSPVAEAASRDGEHQWSKGQGGGPGRRSHAGGMWANAEMQTDRFPFGVSADRPILYSSVRKHLK